MNTRIGTNLGLQKLHGFVVAALLAVLCEDVSHGAFQVCAELDRHGGKVVPVCSLACTVHT